MIIDTAVILPSTSHRKVRVTSPQPLVCLFRHEFCWRCLADYRPILNRGNHHHKPTCTYYAHYESSDDGGGGEEDDEDEDNDDEDSDEHDDDEDDDDEDDDDEGDDDEGVISLSDDDIDGKLQHR